MSVAGVCVAGQTGQSLNARLDEPTNLTLYRNSGRNGLIG